MHMQNPIQYIMSVACSENQIEQIRQQFQGHKEPCSHAEVMGIKCNYTEQYLTTLHCHNASHSDWTKL